MAYHCLITPPSLATDNSSVLEHEFFKIVKVTYPNRIEYKIGTFIISHQHDTDEYICKEEASSGTLYARNAKELYNNMERLYANINETFDQLCNSTDDS